MGLFWDLIQQSSINEQTTKTKKLEDRVLQLEHELQETKTLLRKTLIVLEEYTNKDIDGDGKTGS